MTASILNWGMRDYWVTLLCDGHRHAIIVEAGTGGQAAAFARVRFPECTILDVTLAKGWD